MSDIAAQLKQALKAKGLESDVYWSNNIDSTGDAGIAGYYAPDLEGVHCKLHDGRTIAHSGFLGCEPAVGTAYVDDIKTLELPFNP